MTTLGTQLFTWLRGGLVGEDALGDRTYRERGAMFAAPVAPNR